MKDLVTQGGPRSLYRCFLKILLILVLKRADVKDNAVVLIMLILTSSADFAEHKIL